MGFMVAFGLVSMMIVSAMIIRIRAVFFTEYVGACIYYWWVNRPGCYECRT